MQRRQLRHWINYLHDPRPDRQSPHPGIRDVGKHSNFSPSKPILRSEFPRYQTLILCHILQHFAKRSNAGSEQQVVIVVTVLGIDARQARTHALG